MVCMSAEYNYQNGKVSIDNFMLCADYKYNRHFEPAAEPNFQSSILSTTFYIRIICFFFSLNAESEFVSFAAA